MERFDGVLRELVAIKQAHDERVRNDVAMLGEMYQSEVLQAVVSFECTGDESDACQYCESHCFDDKPVGCYFGHEVQRQGISLGR